MKAWLPKKAAVIGGYGGMGSLFARLLVDACIDVVIAGPNKRKGEDTAAEIGAKYESDNSKAVTGADVVVITVPMEATAGVIKDVAPLVGGGSLLMDLTSIKQEPCRMMAENSAEDVEVVGCHPVFGPSVSSIAGQAFILTPVRGEAGLAWLKDFLEGQKAQITVASPKEHDHAMAVIQGLTHFSYISVGKTLDNLDFKVKESRNYSSPIYDLMLDMVGRILCQNPLLYAEIQMENPEVLSIHRAFLESAKDLSSIVEAGDRQAFVKYMQAAAKNFGDPEEAQARSDKALAALMREIETLKGSIGKEICLEHIYSKVRHIGIVEELFPDSVVILDGGKKKKLKTSNLRILTGSEESDAKRERFGSIRRDYSFIFPVGVDEELISSLLKLRGEVLSSVVKDVFTGKSIPEDSKSICFSVELLTTDIKDREERVASFLKKLGGVQR